MDEGASLTAFARGDFAPEADPPAKVLGASYSLAWLKHKGAVSTTGRQRAPGAAKPRRGAPQFDETTFCGEPLAKASMLSIVVSIIRRTASLVLYAL